MYISEFITYLNLITASTSFPPLCNQSNSVHTLQTIFLFNYTLPCNLCLWFSSNLILSVFRNKMLYPLPINATRPTTSSSVIHSNNIERNKLGRKNWYNEICIQDLVGKSGRKNLLERPKHTRKYNTKFFLQ
jgi:hypothetical protein